MAKTIEEMAKEQYPNSFYKGYELNLQHAYKAGANDVLAEIKRTISVSKPEYLEDNLKKLIKDLTDGTEN